MPFLNESATLPQLIDGLNVLRQRLPIEVLYVDNGSTDASGAIVAARAQPGDHVFVQTERGKGAAVRLGIPACTGTYTVIQDADGEYDPADLSKLVAHAETHNLRAVFGSRRLHSNPTAHLAYYAAGVIITKIHNGLYGTRLTDQPTCYKLVQTDLLQQLPLGASGFDLDTELSCALARRCIEIGEVPITYHPRTRAQGKKIGLRDFWITLLRLAQYRLGPVRDAGSTLPRRPVPPPSPQN